MHTKKVINSIRDTTVLIVLMLCNTPAYFRTTAGQENQLTGSHNSLLQAQ